MTDARPETADHPETVEPATGDHRETPAGAGRGAPAGTGDPGPARQVGAAARTAAPVPARPRRAAAAPGTAASPGTKAKPLVAAKKDPAKPRTAAKRATTGRSRRPRAKKSTPQAPDRVHDVLIIGGGPAGSACAYWLADAGWDVVVVEKKRFPREKTCGDGLTPRAVRQLADMGLEGALVDAHRYSGLRACGFGRSIEMEWPTLDAFPSYGYTITRHDLDGLVAERAEKAGATVLQGTEAVSPLLGDGPGAEEAGTGSPGAQGSPAGPGAPVVSDGSAGRGSPLPPCRGAVVRDARSGTTSEVRARYVVVADGANSRFGRALGTSRDKSHPMGMALRGYFRSPRHDDGYIESHLDIRDAGGQIVPGYGWIFPMGDGRVNVGVGLLSTDQRWKGVNTSRLMEAFVDWAPRSWGISPETSCGPPTGGRLPMGLAVGPHAGPNVVVAGDAGGSINPFNGEGIAYGYETGRLSAAALGRALLGAGPDALRAYEEDLLSSYGAYFRVAQAFVRLISRPDLMRLCVGVGMRSEWLMGELLRIMANLMLSDHDGPAEVAYRAMDRVAQGIEELEAVRGRLAGNGP